MKVPEFWFVLRFEGSHRVVDVEQQFLKKHQAPDAVSASRIVALVIEQLGELSRNARSCAA